MYQPLPLLFILKMRLHSKWNLIKITAPRVHKFKRTNTITQSTIRTRLKYTYINITMV